MVILIPCVIAIAVSPFQGTAFADRDSSNTTYIGVNTGNASLEFLQGNRSGSSDSNVSENNVPVDSEVICQVPFGNPNGTAVSEPVNEGSTFTFDSNPEDGASLSGSELQLALVMVLTAMIFLVSQAAPLRKDPSACRTH